MKLACALVCQGFRTSVARDVHLTSTSRKPPAERGSRLEKKMYVSCFFCTSDHLTHIWRTLHLTCDCCNCFVLFWTSPVKNLVKILPNPAGYQTITFNAGLASWYITSCGELDWNVYIKRCCLQIRFPEMHDHMGAESVPAVCRTFSFWSVMLTRWDRCYILGKNVNDLNHSNAESQRKSHVTEQPLNIFLSQSASLYII